MPLGDKDKRILAIMERWITSEISSEQADKELKQAGVKLPKESVNKRGIK
jgi:hypothetical protein